MKRKIKFRAWDEDGFMFYPTKIEFNKDGTITVWNGDNFGVLGSSVISLMQLTELKDKRGEEIYEGDIVKVDAGTFLEGNELSEDRNFLIDQVYYDEFGDENNRLIIGNIYETPEITDYV
jgi:hypothetical protein